MYFDYVVPLILSTIHIEYSQICWFNTIINYGRHTPKKACESQYKYSGHKTGAGTPGKYTQWWLTSWYKKSTNQCGYAWPSAWLNKNRKKAQPFLICSRDVIFKNRLHIRSKQIKNEFKLRGKCQYLINALFSIFSLSLLSNPKWDSVSTKPELASRDPQTSYAACFCMALELRIAFIFSNVKKKGGRRVGKK